MTTLHDFLKMGASRWGERTAIRFEDRDISYAELLSVAERFAAGMYAAGVRESDRIAIVMENSLEATIAWLATGILGSMDVPINPQYRGALLAYLLDDSAATVTICDGEFLTQIAEAAGATPHLRLAIVAGSPPTGSDQAGKLEVAGFHDIDAPAAKLPSPRASDEEIVLYTSGTTGPSKGVIHTQRSSLTLARYNAKMLRYGADDRLLNFFPLYHQNARYTGVLPALSVGASIRLQRRFSASGFWPTCHSDGTTAFNYLGSVLRLILNVTPPEMTATDHTIRKAFGAGAPPEIWKYCEEYLGIRFVETYGLSEAPMATVNDGLSDDRTPVGSAGRASELFEVAVLDESDNVLPADTVGEIALRPRVPDALMAGYLNKDAATVTAYRNLWFHSGDRGRLSPSGHLYFEERGKDSIRRRGENISAWEVESILDQHPNVAESAVFAVASEEADEDVAAAIVLNDPSANLADILAFAEARLPKYAVPSLFKVVGDLPRTPTAKVQKAVLRREGRTGCTPAADLRRN